MYTPEYFFYGKYGKNVKSAQMLELSLIGAGVVLRLGIVWMQGNY